MGKFVICAQHHVKEGAMERWLSLARANAAASLKEPKVERFDVLLDRDDKNRALLYEIYESYEAWLEHCQQPHFEAFVEGVKDLIEKRVRGYYDLQA